ncbi:uncharacterized protein [Gossypium hirsutum]|uniref:Tf2-1-like SH3-like domain-containing protein n=1 Tax=Gossypium hirsutum TaxID=3635 RepID=A0A1U8J110_GOSHI|nr:uncharacterized protein LOC107902330 [Gossypium hirsutum]
MDGLLVLRFRQVENREILDFGLNSEGVLCFRERVCVPKDFDLRQSILQEVHNSPYAMHPGENKLYRDLRLLQPVKISLWKWQRVTMDFVSVLPLTPAKKDSVWVIVDRLTKSTHFIPVRTDYSLQKFAKLYVDEIVRLHGVRLIRDRLKIASDRQKSYADLKRKEIEYSIGDYVFLKVSPWKKILRFGWKRRLSPRFIGPYHILKRVRPVVYQLELPPELDRIHDVFHVSMLRCYRSDTTHIVLVKKIEVRLDLTFEEEPVQILDREVKVLRRKSIPLVKVHWHNHGSEEATWEPEEAM